MRRLWQIIRLGFADRSHDYATALRLRRSLAEQGDANEQYNLGIMYGKGEGVPQDIVQAHMWFDLAAAQGHENAQNNRDIAASQMTPDQIAEAQTNLGLMYADGEGVPKDYAEAVKWFRMAAEQGHVHAQYNLGVLYSEGRGVGQDYVEAAKWYRKAAEQGSVDAQYNLGAMYAQGQGVRQDFVQAHIQFSLAAAAGSEGAQKNRDMVANNMTPDQIVEAQRLAREWMEKHQR